MSKEIKEILETLEKGRKALPVGTEKVWGGIRYRKDGSGKWLPVKEGSAQSKGESQEPKPSSSIEPPTEQKTPLVDEERVEKITQAANRWFTMSAEERQKILNNVPKKDRTEYWHAEAIAHLARHGDKAFEVKHPDLETKSEKVGPQLPGVEGMKTESLERLTRKYRTKIKIDGEPSDIPYKRLKDSKSNMIGFVAFGKAPKKAQEQLNKMLTDADIIMNDIGFRFKTPIDFVCQKLQTGRSTTAQYINRVTAVDNPRINIVSRDDGISKSLMHEIGHAVDYAMEERPEVNRSGAMMFSKEPSEVKALHQELYELVNSSEYYTANKKEDRAHYNYLTEPTEVFARAFEVYAYERGKRLVEAGKIDKSFLTDFKPDIFKTKNENLTEVLDAYKDVTSRLTKAWNKQGEVNRRLHKEAMEELGLTPEQLPFGGATAEQYENQDRLTQLLSKKRDEDEEYKEISHELSVLSDQRKSLKETAEKIRKEEGAWTLVPEEKQKEYSEKITAIMDKLLKLDPVKKALVASGLFEILEKVAKSNSSDVASVAVLGGKLPKNVLNNLHSPKNVVLAKLGLLTENSESEVEKATKIKNMPKEDFLKWLKGPAQTIESLFKGGPGSGIKGHTTAKPQTAPKAPALSEQMKNNPETSSTYEAIKSQIDAIIKQREEGALKIAQLQKQLYDMVNNDPKYAPNFESPPEFDPDEDEKTKPGS